MQQALDYLNKPIISIGDNMLSIFTLILLVIAFVLVFVVASIAQRYMIKRFLARYNIEYSTRLTIAMFIRYLIIIVGLLVVFQSAGINLSTLSILFGALGVGIGFGLQNITNNLISGIIILFEKPIKIGDRVEVGDTEGVVDTITTRSKRSLQTIIFLLLFPTLNLYPNG